MPKPRFGPDTPRFTTDEAAAYLGVGVRTIERWTAQRRVAHYRLGGRVLFSRNDLDAMLERREAVTSGET